jgi:hypothetical protein
MCQQELAYMYHYFRRYQEQNKQFLQVKFADNCRYILCDIGTLVTGLGMLRRN